MNACKKKKKTGEIHTFNNASLRDCREVYYSCILHKSIKQMPFNAHAPAPAYQSEAVQSRHTGGRTYFSGLIRTQELPLKYFLSC